MSFVAVLEAELVIVGILKPYYPRGCASGAALVGSFLMAISPWDIHFSRFAAEYEPDYGFYRTPGGKPRVSEHHPSSSSINDAEILQRYEAARARAITPKGRAGST